MLAVAFDTLKLAKKLESAGLPLKQAQDTSTALSETFTEWLSVGNVAMREDVEKVRADLGARIDKLELRFDAKLSEVKADILKWMFGSIAVQTIVLLGALIGLVHGSSRM